MSNPYMWVESKNAFLMWRVLCRISQLQPRPQSPPSNPVSIVGDKITEMDRTERAENGEDCWLSVIVMRNSTAMFMRINQTK